MAARSRRSTGRYPPSVSRAQPAPPGGSPAAMMTRETITVGQHRFRIGPWQADARRRPPVPAAASVPDRASTTCGCRARASCARRGYSVGAHLRARGERGHARSSRRWDSRSTTDCGCWSTTCASLDPLTAAPVDACACGAADDRDRADRPGRRRAGLPHVLAARRRRPDRRRGGHAAQPGSGSRPLEGTVVGLRHHRPGWRRRVPPAPGHRPRPCSGAGIGTTLVVDALRWCLRRRCQPGATSTPR